MQSYQRMEFIICFLPCSSGGDFTITYGTDSQSDFGRCFLLTVPLHVKPGLQVKNFNIASCSLDVFDEDAIPYRSGICLIVCEVMNPTARGFRLECTIIDGTIFIFFMYAFL